jgi:hypothetical protein
MELAVPPDTADDRDEAGAKGDKANAPASSPSSSAAAVAAAAAVGAGAVVAAVAAGAGPSSAAPASSTAAAAAVGASAGSIFVKRAGDAGVVFAKVPIFHGDVISDLAVRAMDKFSWPVGADKIKLFLVKLGGEDEPTDEEEAAALAQQHLGVGWSLSRARIASGAWVVAQMMLGAPAAAPGESTRAACSGLHFALAK